MSNLNNAAAMYAQALELAKEKASLTYVQRKLKTSYAKAEELLEQAVSEGLITDYTGRNELARLRRRIVQLSQLHDHACLVADAAKERIAELETRLEINPRAPHIDGILCRDESIKLQDEQIAKLKAQLAEARTALAASEPSQGAGAAGSVADEPHPPSRHCMCAACAPSFDDDALLAAQQPARKPQMDERVPQCWCTTCRPRTLSDQRFVVCPTCGFKRCPHAANHNNPCTGSNAPGQKGSSWENVKR